MNEIDFWFLETLHFNNYMKDFHWNESSRAFAWNFFNPKSFTRHRRNKNDLISQYSSHCLFIINNLFASQNPALDLSHDDDNSEISGEFGDNISMTSTRHHDIISTTVLAPPLPPPDEDVSQSCSDYFAILKSNHMKALIWKNFLWMWRNFGWVALTHVMG